MPAPPRLQIRPAAATHAACALLARAMRDNPTHVAVFGRDAQQRAQRLHVFFGGVLPWIAGHGLLLAASEGSRLVGVFALQPPPRCRPAGWQLLRLGLRIVRGQSPAQIWRMLRWLHAWRKNDAQVAHWHLGPLAVAPASQGRGVGSALMRHALQIVDAQPALCHLETDLPRNVALYTRFGFDVTSQKTVLGVPNWFMQRRART
ncbi:MAG: GNAT family N-acetyltransferase [Ottowia sp.]|nr:GNAT family N-acetyltransferase [Ottowia sp.]